MLHAGKTDTEGTLQQSTVLLCLEAVPLPEKKLFKHHAEAEGAEPEV